MSWIKTIEADEATGTLREIYNSIMGARGKLANIHKIQSLDPDSIKIHMDLYLHLMFGASGLARKEREMIAVIVSIANQCDYCISHHMEALRAYWKDEAALEIFKEEFRSVCSRREIAMLRYADKLTRDPSSVMETDIAAMRDADLSDEDILRIALITCYFNFVNRMATGLGVPFSEEETRGYNP